MVSRTLWRSLAHALLGGTAVAGLTYVWLRLQLDVGTAALLDLMAIVFLSLIGTFLSSAVVALAAALSLHFCFISPRLSWWLDDPLDVAALAVFLTTALIITRLLSRARQSLREAQKAQEELRLAIDTIPALVWTTRPDGSGEFSNQRWLDYTGLARDEAQEWGYASAIHPEDYQRLLPGWTASFKTGEPIEDEARLRRSDGVYRWFLQRAVPLRDPLGRIVKWYGTSTDIEDRKEAEQVLREQANLLDLTHDTVFVRDMSDVITYWNRGAAQLYGWSSEEAIGKVTHQLLHTIFPKPLEEITTELLRTGRWEGEIIHTKRNGTQVSVASRWSLQRDPEGHPVGTLETNNDITPRKQAEAALRRSEAFLAQAQQLGRTGSFRWNVTTGELAWSEEGFRIFGYDPATAQPTLEAALARVHPEDVENVRQYMASVTTEPREWELDHRLLLPDGSVKFVHVVGRPTQDRAGNLEYIGALLDVTAAKRAQMQLRRVRERALKARFGAVLDERTRLAREIHDTLLQGFTGIALKLVAVANNLAGLPEASAALRDVVALAQKTLGDARRAVWDLRAPPIGEGDFTSGLRSLAEDAVRGTGLTLEFEVQGVPRAVDPNVEAAAVRVVQESISNIVKHANARRVSVRLSFEPGRLRLSVRDDGRGFTVESNLQAYGGHWGLLGMRERATQLHGALKVRSALGEGTEVVLLVPYRLRQGSRRRAASAPLG